MTENETIKMTNVTAIKTRHCGSLVTTYKNTLTRLGSTTYDVPMLEITGESLNIKKKNSTYTSLHC